MLNRVGYPRRVTLPVLLSIAAAVVTAAVVATPGWARLQHAVSPFFPWTGASGETPTLGTSKAAELFSIPGTAGRTVTFWTVPTSAGGTCLATRIVTKSGQPPSDAPPAFANGGLNCSIGGAAQPAGQIQVFLTWTHDDGTSSAGWSVMLVGHLPDASGMSGAELVTPNSTSQLGVHDGYFAAVLPGTASSSGVLPTSGAYAVVGLDAHGAVAQTVDLDALVAATTP